MSLFSWLAGLFDDTPAPSKPRPPDWNKTLADLSAEQRNLSGQEIEWARDYEREQLRAWARFPKDGEHFEARHDVRVSYLIHWRAPYTTGGEGVLPMGTRVRISVAPGDAEPIGVYAMPLDEQAMAQLLIPELDRLSGKYDGFSISLTVAQLNTDFVLMPL